MIWRWTSAAREREASAQAGRILEECQAEMRLIVRAGLDSLGELGDQIGPAWDARAAVTDALAPAPSAAPGAAELGPVTLRDK
ncbi:MAG TPA: hypothetical protein VMV92_26675 [Streptosporangiaceae bacterium]|nr:hypothetical protein [Streptosporangiaceae bacterium]